MKNSTDNSHNSAKDLKQLGYVSFQFLTLGGSMGPRNVLQLYLLKNHKIDNNSTTTEAKEKSANLESLEI